MSSSRIGLRYVCLALGFIILLALCLAACGSTEVPVTTATAGVATSMTEDPVSTNTNSHPSTTMAGVDIGPYVDEVELEAAQDAVYGYMKDVREDGAAHFASLVDPQSEVDAGVLFGIERGLYGDAGSEHFEVATLVPMVWVEDHYFIDVPVPIGIDEWIRESPDCRVAMETTMRDGSVRVLRVQHNLNTDEWLIFPNPVVADAYPDYTSEPEPVATATAQLLGKYAADSVAFSGLELIRAVELTHPDWEQSVIEVQLEPKADGSTGQVLISIFKDEQTLFEPVEPAPAGGSEIVSYDENTGYTVERISIPGAYRASCITGPFGSHCQVTATIADGTVVNVNSETGLPKGGDLPLDRDGVVRLVSLLVDKIQADYPNGW
jgi:hypothetical protein